jgi:hypothetical protein
MRATAKPKRKSPMMICASIRQGEFTRIPRSARWAEHSLVLGLRFSRAVVATITQEQLEAGYVPEELRFDEVTTALCPHCGAVQVSLGFSVIDAFICSECGQCVGVERPIQ